MNKAKDMEIWKEAKRRCRLGEEEIRMAKEMGINPRSLIKNIPNKSEQWKAPVKDWIHDMYAKRQAKAAQKAKRKAMNEQKKTSIRILFVCHGNICRSPMAEFVMKDLARRAGCEDRFVIASAATTTDELGNDIYPNAKEELKKHGIPFERRQARQLRRGEYADWDYIVAMDGENLEDIPDRLGLDLEHKVRLLLSFAGEERPVSDPWYTRDFETAYQDISLGCKALLEEALRARH